MTALKSDTGQGFNIGFPKFRAITEAIWLRRKVGDGSQWHAPAECTASKAARLQRAGVQREGVQRARVQREGVHAPAGAATVYRWPGGAGVGGGGDALRPWTRGAPCGVHNRVPQGLAKWGEEEGIISLPQRHSGAWDTVPCVGLEGARTVPAKACSSPQALLDAHAGVPTALTLHHGVPGRLDEAPLRPQRSRPSPLRPAGVLPPHLALLAKQGTLAQCLASTELQNAPVAQALVAHMAPKVLEVLAEATDSPRAAWGVQQLPPPPPATMLGCSLGGPQHGQQPRTADRRQLWISIPYPPPPC